MAIETHWRCHDDNDWNIILNVHKQWMNVKKWIQLNGYRNFHTTHLPFYLGQMHAICLLFCRFYEELRWFVWHSPTSLHQLLNDNTLEAANQSFLVSSAGQHVPFTAAKGAWHCPALDSEPQLLTRYPQVSKHWSKLLFISNPAKMLMRLLMP